MSLFRLIHTKYKRARNRCKRWLRIQYYGIVDIGQTIPVHNYFGLKMRWVAMQPHHLYWGFILMALTGYWTQSSDLLVFSIAYALFCLGGYVFLDDVWQHHNQVKHPEYHSPVHNWYVNNVYNGNGWMARAIRKLNDWADGK